MAKFRQKSGGESPEVSTASLPDIVFMLLFFFMVTTVMREVDLKVNIELPEASEIQKLEKKALVMYFYIGPPMNEEIHGTVPKIQVADDFIETPMIGQAVEAFRANKNEKEIPLLTYSLKVDKETKMGVISDVKIELREVQALKLNYSTNAAVDD